MDGVRRQAPYGLDLLGQLHGVDGHGALCVLLDVIGMGEQPDDREPGDAMIHKAHALGVSVETHEHACAGVTNSRIACHGVADSPLRRNKLGSVTALESPRLDPVRIEGEQMKHHHSCTQIREVDQRHQPEMHR